MEELWSGGPKYRQDERAFPLSTDSVLLAHFAAGVKARRIRDLGCGAGALSVLLLVSHPAAELGGVEIDAEAAALCRENLEANGFDAGGIVTGDLRDHAALWKAGACDLVVSNPPYFAAGRGRVSPDERRGAARSEGACTLDDLCAAAGWLLRRGGAFALVHRPERLAEIFRALAAGGMEPKRMRLVQYKAAYAPSLVLLEARKGGRPGLNVEKPLILCEADGNDTEEIKEIYHRA